ADFADTPAGLLQQASRQNVTGRPTTMSMTMDSLAASVRRFSPRLLLSELLLKQWFEPVIPFTVMIGLWLYFALTIPDYATMQNTLSLLRLFAEFGFVALAMGFCLISGGIDLGVVAIFALCYLACLSFVLGPY